MKVFKVFNYKYVVWTNFINEIHLENISDVPSFSFIKRCSSKFDRLESLSRCRCYAWSSNIKWGIVPHREELTFNRHQGLCLGSDSNLCNTFSSGASIWIQLESNIREVQRVKLKAEAAYGSLQTTERVVSKNIEMCETF